jgi:hypothetical protein
VNVSVRDVPVPSPKRPPANEGWTLTRVVWQENVNSRPEYLRGYLTARGEPTGPLS